MSDMLKIFKAYILINSKSLEIFLKNTEIDSYLVFLKNHFVMFEIFENRQKKFDYFLNLIKDYLPENSQEKSKLTEKILIYENLVLKLREQIIYLRKELENSIYSDSNTKYKNLETLLLNYEKNLDRLSFDETFSKELVN